MSPTPSIFPRPCLTLTLALAACAPHAPLPTTDAPSLEQRLFDLEHRVERLEARSFGEPPYRNKAEIQAHIRALEEERSKLLIGYTVQHPAIKDIDRKLMILDSQLKMLESP